MSTSTTKHHHIQRICFLQRMGFVLYRVIHVELCALIFQESRLKLSFLYLYMLPCGVIIHQLFTMYLTSICITAMPRIKVPCTHIKRSFILKSKSAKPDHSQNTTSFDKIITNFIPFDRRTNVLFFQISASLSIRKSLHRGKPSQCHSIIISFI